MENKKYKEEEISFINCGLPVYGTLTLPESGLADYGMILLHSSERSHRDEDYFTEISGILAESGIAVLRYDSPGSGKSPGKSFMQSFEDRKNEAVSAFEFLKKDERIKTDSIGFSGLSEGSTIAFMAGSELNDCRFIIPVSADYKVYTVENLLKDIRNDVKEEGHTEKRVEHEIFTSKLWFRFFNLLDVNLDDCKKRAEELGNGPWSSILDLLGKCEAMSASERLTSLLEIHNSQTADYSDYQYMDYFLDEIAGNNLTPEEFEKNYMIWSEFVSNNITDYLSNIHCPVFACWGGNDPYMNTEQTKKQFDHFLCDNDLPGWSFRIYPDAGHGLEDENEKVSISFFNDVSDWILKL